MNSNQALSNSEILALAPSAFATQPYVGQSSKYAFIPTSNVIEGMRQNGFLPFRASQSRSRIEGKAEFSKHMIRFRSVDAMTVAVGDSLPEIVLINSHDGTSAYKLFFGIFRLVCSNGMVVADSLLGQISVKHIGDVVREVIEGSQKLIQSAPAVLDTVREWQTIDLQPAESLALATSAHKYRFADVEVPPVGVTPERLLRARRSEDEGSDLWRTFNRVQENLSQGIRGRVDQSTGRRTGVQGIKSIDGDVKLNRALWTLASEMAKIKAA